ncbi:hypothetical protein H4S06_002656 [Coemansia sp. BCRC 34490]|nr:hypothetical protein H4S06_002656 [Coemansia sp. BCRC 34490]
MLVYKDIPYIDDNDPKHRLDLYIDDKKQQHQKPAQLVVYIHGGAWRMGDKREFGALCEGIVDAAGGSVAVAAINYRLSVRGDAQTRHPMHLNDVLAAIRFLAASGAGYPGSSRVDAGRTVLVGHSAGAHLAMLAALQQSPTAAAATTAAVVGVVGAGGIYDIPDLVATHPSYADFIDMAFTETQRLTASPYHVARTQDVLPTGIRFLLVNSTADELVPSVQAASMAQQLVARECADVSLVVRDIGTHDGELFTEQFWRIVADFAAADPAMPI